MKALIFLVAVELSTGALLAQDADVFRVKSGNKAEEVVPVALKYRYETFRTGSVSYYNGRTATARLNYNILLGEMQFIDITGDTLSLADEHIIQHIKIGENAFYYDPRYGYLELVAEYPKVKLSIQQSFSTVLKEKKGAYEQSTGVSSIRNYSAYSTGNSQVHRLQSNEDYLIGKDINYFLIDHNNYVHRANKSALKKLFAQQKKAIATYLNEEKIDFDKEEDLRRLLQYCTEISL